VSALAVVAPIMGPLDFDEYVADWLDHLRAEGKSPNTVATYGYGVASLRAFLVAKRWPLDLAQLTTKRLGAWQRDTLASRSDATARNYHHGVRMLFVWLVAEGELDVTPFDGLAAPTLSEKIVPVVSLDALRLLVRSCEGNTLKDVRDAAILRLFIDCGVRLAELTNVTLDDIDKRARAMKVTGKGGKQRTVNYGPKAAVALNRYMRARARHPLADTPALWLGKRGRMTRSGLYQVVRDRATAAGFTIHPHQFRHTFAHEWKKAGGSDSDLMAFCGWSAPSMVLRYGKSAASERAQLAHAKLALGERV
jgi:site-specific recombinase XerD